tara:strand:- start:17892 stop:18221 length:330 start_codon:yes stop_codon:yes gene_type:complete
MAWHTTREGGTTQKCVKYPDQVGFSTVLVGGFSTVLSHQARNDWMDYVNGLNEYREYRTAEQKLLAIQYQQNGNPNDLSWAIVARERVFHNAEKALYNIAQAWASVPVA